MHDEIYREFNTQSKTSFFNLNFLFFGLIDNIAKYIMVIQKCQSTMENVHKRFSEKHVRRLYLNLIIFAPFFSLAYVWEREKIYFT